jgi:hypothetical protein
MATNSEILVHAAAAVGESSSSRASQRRFTFSCHPHTQGVGTTAMTSFKCGDSRSPKYSPIRPGSYALARSPPARTIDSFPGAQVELRLYFRVCSRPISGGSLATLIDRNPQSSLGAKKCPRARQVGMQKRPPASANHADGSYEITHAEGKRGINS